MSSQCPPCSCLEEPARSDPGAAVTPEQNSQDFCPSCPCDPSRTPLGVTSQSDSGNSRRDSGKSHGMEEPLTFDTPGMCTMKFPLQKSILTVELCPAGTCLDDLEEVSLEKLSLEKLSLEKLSPELPGANLEGCTLQVLDLGEGEACQAQGAIPGDPCVSKIGISTDPQIGISMNSCSSQIGISADPCVPKSGISVDPQIGISMDSCASQIGISMDPCTSQISTDPSAPQIRISTDPQIGISTDPCVSQIPTDPCNSQISADPGAPQSQGIGGSRPSPFRLHSCTSSIVERCLSRCQSWFRGKN